MYFTGGEGKLEEVRLLCEKHYIAFQVDRDFSYDIPDEWGDCLMSVVGDPEASFNLVQH